MYAGVKWIAVATKKMSENQNKWHICVTYNGTIFYSGSTMASWNKIVKSAHMKSEVLECKLNQVQAILKLSKCLTSELQQEEAKPNPGACLKGWHGVAQALPELGLAPQCHWLEYCQSHNAQRHWITALAGPSVRPSTRQQAHSHHTESNVFYANISNSALISHEPPDSFTVPLPLEKKIPDSPLNKPYDRMKTFF